MTKIDTLRNQHKPKNRYKITNWTEYNVGLKQRGSLTLWMDDKVAQS